ncbi:MAG: transposase [Panacagrimonas sp.]
MDLSPNDIEVRLRNILCWVTDLPAGVAVDVLAAAEEDFERSVPGHWKYLWGQLDEYLSNRLVAKFKNEGWSVGPIPEEYLNNVLVSKKKSHFTLAQKVAILKQADAGMLVDDIIREAGITEATFNNWKSTYGSRDASLLKSDLELEAQVATLQQKYADFRKIIRARKDLNTEN